MIETTEAHPNERVSLCFEIQSQAEPNSSSINYTTVCLVFKDG